MDKEKIILRLQKLLALAQSNNAHEASLAQKRAGEIMAKYSISQEEITITKGNDIDPNMACARMDMLGSYMQEWEMILVNEVTGTFECRTVITTLGNKHQILMIGFKSDLLLAGWYHQYLRDLIDTKAKELFKKDSDRSSFSYAATIVVCDRLKEIRRYKEAFVPADSKYLLVIKNDAVTKFMKKHFPDLEKLEKEDDKKMDGSFAAYLAGIQLGLNVSLSTPIAQGKDSARLGG